jgi:hypothetical protein
VFKSSLTRRYQSQSYILTQGLALQVAVNRCKGKCVEEAFAARKLMLRVLRFLALLSYIAGRNTGPIRDWWIYDVMCSDECLETDTLHQDAMTASDCTCLELSTQTDDDSYHIEGDFCSENSARLMCTFLGHCGDWDCRISDFMCPRYAYNFLGNIQHRGPASCKTSSAFTAPTTLVMNCWLVVLMLAM